ncbi:hypothetical protein L195_g056079, partial [Trifolium pratense]
DKGSSLRVCHPCRKHYILCNVTNKSTRGWFVLNGFAVGRICEATTSPLRFKEEVVMNLVSLRWFYSPHVLPTPLERLRLKLDFRPPAKPPSLLASFSTVRSSATKMKRFSTTMLI